MQASIHFVEAVYTESKFWIALIGAVWACFNGIQWIKTIKTNDLHHIQLGVDGLHAELKDQTQQIVGELRETRSVLMRVAENTAPRAYSRKRAK